MCGGSERPFPQYRIPKHRAFYKPRQNPACTKGPGTVNFVLSQRDVQWISHQKLAALGAAAIVGIRSSVPWVAAATVPCLCYRDFNCYSCKPTTSLYKLYLVPSFVAVVVFIVCCVMLPAGIQDFMASNLIYFTHIVVPNATTSNICRSATFPVLRATFW